MGLITAALAVAGAWLLAVAIDSAFLGGAGLDSLGATLAALAVVLAARAGVSWAQEWVARRCSAAVKSSLRMELLRRVALAPGSAAGRESAAGPGSGEVVALATRGLDSLDAYFARYLPQLVLAGIVPDVVIA